MNLDFSECNTLLRASNSMLPFSESLAMITTVRELRIALSNAKIKN